jgi:hypothetical protein
MNYEAELKKKGKEVTKVAPGVSIGLKKSSYIAPTRKGWANRPAAEKITQGDEKFQMYANALPSAIRAKVIYAGYDPRELYKEYRAIGKDAMVEKYKDLPEPE